MPQLYRLLSFLLLSSILGSVGLSQQFKIAHFQIDATIPIGHRCMGVLPQKSKTISDALEVHGFILLGKSSPVIIVAIDWCEIRNKSYDEWRKRIAKAAHTLPERVLVSALHQHDAPVIDAGAQDLLDSVGLKDELFDRAFHQEVLNRTEQAIALAIQDAQPITHIGYAESNVKDVASNRRVVDSLGKVSFARGSSSGRDPFFRETTEGLIDPVLRTISFWNENQSIVEYHAYATHPMSYYGRGEVSADFVGLARKELARSDRSIHPIYASGCSGDVTAGKFNDGSPQAREELTFKILEAMRRNRTTVAKSQLIREWEFHCLPLELEYTKVESLQKQAMEKELNDTKLPVEKRILAAMGLSSWKRVIEDRQPIDVPCVDLGIAKILLFPGESFVGYQKIAQSISGQVPVISVGYGESWTGYIPTDDAFKDGFNESWLWVAPGAQGRIETVLKSLLGI